MLTKHIEWLSCPDCRGEIELKSGGVCNGELIDGVLGCRLCLRLFPVIDGVPVMFVKDSGHSLCLAESARLSAFGYSFDDLSSKQKICADQRKMQVAVRENWEYQWQEVHPFDIEELEGDGFYGRGAFLNFIPVPPADYPGAIVFVGGAGRGREVYHISSMGSQTVVALDLGREIGAIKRIVPPETGVELLLLRADLVAIPLKEGIIDISICDHALQHVHDHNKGFQEMTRITKIGGRCAVCVYSYEGNQLMTHLIEPMKRVFHKLPLRLLYLLSLIPTLVVYYLIICFYLPLSAIIPIRAEKMPLYHHMMMWSRNSFKSIWVSVFDLIHAPISHHFSRSEVERLVVAGGFQIETLKHTNGVLWSMVAIVSKQ